MTGHPRPLALVTGGSAGLGRALVHSLHDRGWTVVTDGRDAARLAEATRDLDNVAAIPGDIADADLRRLETDSLAAIWDRNTGAPHALHLTLTFREETGVTASGPRRLARSRRSSAPTVGCTRAAAGPSA